MNFKATNLTWGVNRNGLIHLSLEPSAHCPPPPKKIDNNSAARGVGRSVDKAGALCFSTGEFWGFIRSGSGFPSNWFTLHPFMQGYKRENKGRHSTGALRMAGGKRSLMSESQGQAVLATRASARSAALWVWERIKYRVKH